MWFGGFGVVRATDDTNEVFGAAQLGLEGELVWTIIEDRKGHLWFGTRANGVSRYDGQTFTPFTTEDGLGHNSLRSMLEDRQGHLWFGTDAGVVSRYDGQTFQTLTREDGLTGHSVRAIHQDGAGCMWFVTYGGVNRFCPPSPTAPPVVVDAVIADRRYEDRAELALPSTVGLVTFEFHGTSMKTRPGGMVYRYRLNGHDPDWQITGEQHADYEDITTGDYSFEVVAVDRDLVYSVAPAKLRLTVHPPYGAYALWSALVIALGLVAWQTARVVRRDQRLVTANRQIEEATRNKSEFPRRMSHDLRSPMNAIIGYSRLLQRRLADRMDEREARNLANIETSSGNLLNLINDILDLSRIEAGRIEIAPQSVDVRTLADGCADALESIVKEGVTLHRDLADVGVIRSDPDRLRQVVMNLLGNATKFTNVGSITLSLRRADDAVELAVADTGVGIPPEDLPHIFDEFRQVERQGGEQTEGTGLGLAIAKKTVELLGGTLTAESKVGVGTTFTVRIGDYLEQTT